MRKYSLAIIIASVVLLELIGAAQYFLAREGVRQEMLAQAERDINESQRVAAVKGEVESAIRNILPSVQKEVDNPGTLTRLAAQLVVRNHHIVGAGVAFRNDYFKDKRPSRPGLFAPHAFDTNLNDRLTGKDGAKPNVHADRLNFDYTDREWFQKPMADGSSLWTQPYIDKGGTHILMITYCMPVVNARGQRVGVFFADVPMKDVSVLSQKLFTGVSQGRIIILGIQIFSVLVLGFIISRAITASRRYKEQVVDADKERMLEQVSKLKEVNARLTKRNQQLAEKVAELESRVQAYAAQKSDQHWFG